MIGRRQKKCPVANLWWLGLILVFGIAVAACDHGSPTQPPAPFNEHEWIERTRIVMGVRGVKLSMPGNLRIEQGADRVLTTFGDLGLLPAVNAQVRGGILEIWLDPGAAGHPGRPTEFTLTTPILESAELADHGVIDCSGLDGERLSLRLTDTGQLDFENLRASELDVTTAAGTGSVRVSGDIAKQTIELGGLADYQAPNLQSLQARVTISSGGSATVRVRDRLSVTITGSGSVYYLGDPEVESTITGSGRVVRMGS